MLNNNARPLRPPLRRSHPADPLLLVLPQPGLEGVPEHLPPQKVGHLAENDAHKGDRVHEVDRQLEDLDADHDPPEVRREQADVEEGRAAHAEDERARAVEQAQGQRVAGQVSADRGVPHRGPEGAPVEDGGLHAVDDRPPLPELADDLVQRPLGEHELLEDVGQPVEGCAEQREQVALELVARVDRVLVRARDVVARQQDAQPADADQDAEHLGPVVADLEEEEGDDHDDDDGPEVDERGGEDGGVAVGQHGEVVAFDVAEGEEDVLPAPLELEAGVTLGAVAVQRVGEVDEGEEDVVEEGLEGGDRGAFVGEEGGEGVRRREAEGQDLTG